MPESSHTTIDPLSRASAIARRALGSGPAGVASDIDGTLSPIVDDPGAAQLAPGASAALEALLERLAVVAAITGRSTVDARRMLGTDRVLIAGNHGVEWLEPGASQPSPSPGARAARPALERALAAVPDLPGLTVEDKGLSATVHYRAASSPEAARRALLAALGGAAGVVLREGRASVELRPAGAGDKGTALRALVERFGLDGLVVIGDDVTDLDMFGAASELRHAGSIRAAIIGVAGGSEVPARVVAAADVVLRDPAEVVELLRRLAA